jgi:DNA-3-methyladenine glycosylase II
VTDAHETLREDPVLRALIEEFGEIEIDTAEDPFERLVVSIINQSVSTASANAVRDRVFERLDDITPATVLAADADELSDAGLGETKTEYIRNAARAFRERDLGREGFADVSDEEVIDELGEIRGVGEWTARMYLIFALGREDVLPLGDLAVRRGIESLYGDGEELTRGEMREIAERWRPYRSLATLYIWQHYES